MNVWDALKGDTYRQFGRYGWGLTLKAALTSRTFRVVATMRLCQAAKVSNGPFRLALPFMKVLHRMATNGAATDFPWSTDIGPGFALTHGWAAVISQGARIGRNVTLFHGVTLGRRDSISATGERDIGYPVLEDEVWVGPNATIVGGITIGRGSRIAGGAFVTANVPPFSVVAGNPATIVKSDCVPDVMNPAPLLPN